MSEIATVGSARGYLTDHEMRMIAPSLFSNEPAPGASERYQMVNTYTVVDALRQVGYEPVKAGQAKARNSDTGALFTKHVVRLMHKDYLDPSKRSVGDVVPQVILTNSHDRTSAFHLSAGLYRLLCANGLAVSAAEISGLRVLHNDPSIYEHIIDGTNLIRDITEHVITPQVEAMTKLQLTDQRMHEFAEAATFFKFGEVKDDHVEAFLAVRRPEDEGRSLWNVLNRIQENAVKGGYESVDRIGRHVKARPIANIARDLDFNVNLWTLGAKLLEEAEA